MDEKTLDSLVFPSYVIEIGVISGDDEREYKMEVDKNGVRRKRRKLQTDKYQVNIGNMMSDTGITNAQLMFIHENGSPLHHIPARPVLQKTLDWAKQTDLVVKTMGKCIGILVTTGDLNEIDKEMDRMCIKLQNHARQIIYSNDGQLAPNAPSTIAKKGDNHPLFDTGQLARSITCRAIRITN